MNSAFSIVREVFFPISDATGSGQRGDNASFFFRNNTRYSNIRT